MASPLTSSTTYSNYITATKRQVPVFRSISSQNGVVTGINLSVRLRNSTSAAKNFTFTIYLFKTFKHSTNGTTNWQNRKSSAGTYAYDVWYQYPNNSTYYFSTSYIGDILAHKTVTINSFASQTQTNFTYSDFTLTDYGKNLSNWAGDVCVGIIYDTTDLEWAQNGTSSLEITYTTGTIRYGINNTFVNCEVYYGVDGSFKKVIPYYATNNTFKILG